MIIITLAFAVLLGARSAAASAWSDFDPAYIKQDCNIDYGFAPYYFGDESCHGCHGCCPNGRGWYCVDMNNNYAIRLDGSGQYDPAWIHVGCDPDRAHFFRGDDGGGWYCADDGPWGSVDPNFYAKDCGDPYYPQYSTNADCQNDWGTDCALGDGWYCNNGADVSSAWDTVNKNYFETAFIHNGCDAQDPNDWNKHLTWYCGMWVCIGDDNFNCSNDGEYSKQAMVA